MGQTCSACKTTNQHKIQILNIKQQKQNIVQKKIMQKQDKDKTSQINEYIIKQSSLKTERIKELESQKQKQKTKAKVIDERSFGSIVKQVNLIFLEKIYDNAKEKILNEQQTIKRKKRK